MRTTRTVDEINRAYSDAPRSTESETQKAEVELDAALLQHLLEDCEFRFTTGYGDPAVMEGSGSLALFEAIEACGRAGAPIPSWAADAFTKGFDQVYWADCGSWDDAFGRPWPKRTDMEAKRRHMKMRTEILLRVEDLREGNGGEQPQAVDEALFERVGSEFGIRKSLCNKLYYQEKRRLSAT